MASYGFKDCNQQNLSWSVFHRIGNFNIAFVIEEKCGSHQGCGYCDSLGIDNRKCTCTISLFKGADSLDGSLIGEDPTLTGRTLLWDELVKIAEQRRFLGSGYGGFWIGNIGNNLWEIFQWNPGQAHNGYLDVYIDLGIVGLVFLICLIFLTYRNVLVNLRYDSDYGRYRLALLAMILIYNVTESGFIKPTSLLWFLFC